MAAPFGTYAAEQAMAGALPVTRDGPHNALAPFARAADAFFLTEATAVTISASTAAGSTLTYEGVTVGDLRRAAAAYAVASDVMWLPIAEADRSIATVQTFGGAKLRNSYPVWVRDENGRIYEAVWTDHKQGYWWDLDGEDVAEPIEFAPHPLWKRPTDDPFPSAEGGV